MDFLGIKEQSIIGNLRTACISSRKDSKGSKEMLRATSRFDFLKFINETFLKLLYRPKLTIDLIAGGNSYSTKKWVKKNSAGATVFIYETCWCYQLVLRNDSNYNAHYPLLHFNIVLPLSHKLSVLNHYVPVFAKEEIVLEGEYVILEECEEGKNTKPKGLPDMLKNAKVLVEYQNTYNRKFYSLFEFATRRSFFSTRKPLGFN